VVTVGAATDRTARKLLERARSKFVLAGACALVLAAGAWLAPPRGQRAPAAAEAPAPLLNLESERRAPERMFRAVYEDAGNVARHVVALARAEDATPRTTVDFGRAGEARPPVITGYGVAVAPDRVLSHADALPGRAVIGLGISGASVPMHPVAFDAASGLVLLAFESAALEPASVSAAPLEPGDVTLAVGREHVAWPLVVAGGDGERYAFSGGTARPGTPIFGREGTLVAVATGSGSPMTAQAAGASLERLQRSSGAGLPSSLGLVLQEMTPALEERLGSGALVADVEPGSTADRAGLRPGDVVTALGGDPIASTAALKSVLSAQAVGRTLSVDLHRNRTRLRREVVTQTGLDRWESSDRSALLGVPVGEVFAAEALAAAGVSAESRLIGVDFGPAKASLRRRSSKEVRRLAYLQHEGRRFFTLIEGR
jgi:S1-C subfamily serine protease